ncbi:hypothetical protein HYC85_004978 [Camellia sinensis]|uniref:AMP-dependent synthetase/ligase domain-containing protein n=1 Tax=Camellia sinensis TaxID=4442 RepID=A0A7J7HY37_CAMSI|nr:hypothetical protein HYC85_004978 [Camellia sinensis]
MDIRKGDIVAWPTNLGWMMGPWLVYASLLNGASMALYNGSPLGSGFAKFVQDAKVTMLGVIPSIVRAWKTTNCTASYDWSAIRCFGSTGEASNVDEYLWLMGRAGYKPIIEYCGGTEIGGGFVTGSLLQPQSLAAFSTPAMGCSLFIIGSDGIINPPIVPGIGELALGPLMFGASNTLLNADHYNVYFKGMPVWNGKILRRHGDVFDLTSRGYYHAHGRADDTMNLGGIKLRLNASVMLLITTSLRTAAVGVPPQGGGPERLVIAVVFKDSSESARDLNKLRTAFNSALQNKLNPFFKVSHIVPITSLPRTATNKVYWKTLLDEISVSFSVPPQCILRENQSHPGGQWLPGAHLNPTKNCLSLNGKRTLDDIMVIWRDERDDKMPVNKMTLKELCTEAMQLYPLLIALLQLKLRQGSKYQKQKQSLPRFKSAVELSMPNHPSQLLFPVEAPALASNCVMVTFLGMKVEFVAVEQPVEAFTNILFSSGTTGEPKAIPWTLATPFKAAADGWCHMDIRKGDIVAWPTNLGWMMGPWLVYASLLNRASMALYNGSPLGSGLAKFDAKVTMLGVIPSIARAWKTTNCTASYDWSAIRCFGSAGEASNVDEYLWLMGRAGYKPIIEYCGGTEIGGGFVTGSLFQPQSLAAFSTPAMGCSLFIIGSDRIINPPIVPGIGELALGPLMFGASNTLLNADHYNVYFKGMPVWNGKVVRRHGDVFDLTSRGYYHAHGRADDTMNLGGIKVSSVEIERICNAVDNNILETAAVGVPPQGGGPERLVIAVVFKDSSESARDLNKLRMAFNSALQNKRNPLFKVSHVVPIPALPRTATNKVMRKVLRQQFAQIDQNFKM